jgi:hypothetical protein
MQTVFARLMAENPDRTFYNCSEAGLKLEGAQHIPLAQALEHCREAPVGRNALRFKLYEQFVDYKPQVKDTFFADWDRLRVAMEDLIVWAEALPRLAARAEAVTAETLTVDHWQAATAEDCLTRQEVVESIATLHWHALLDTEKVIQERQTALSLFAIRRFDFLELMSEIPPKDEEVQTELLRAVFNAQRLGRVAQMIREEAPVLRQIFRQVTDRLDHLLDPPGDVNNLTVQRLFARQRYETGLEMLRQTSVHAEGETVVSNQYLQHLYMHYLWHTQQYEAAGALMTQWGLAPGKRAKAEAYLAQWRADVREAMEPYFRTEATPASGSGLEPWMYDE